MRDTSSGRILCLELYLLPSCSGITFLEEILVSHVGWGEGGVLFVHLQAPAQGLRVGVSDVEPRNENVDGWMDEKARNTVPFLWNAFRDFLCRLW